MNVSPFPIILVANINLFLKVGFFLIQVPIIFSVLPAVSIRRGQVEYISAVSKKFIPESKALSICK